MINIKKAAYAVAFFLFTQFMYGSENRPLSFRAVWIVRSTLTSKAEIDKALTFASDNEFNHVFVQVRGRGDAFYSSKIVTKSNTIKAPSFDPLAYAIIRGHKLGLKVHAWVNVYLIWSATNGPASENHLIRRHPEWIDDTFLAMDENYSENGTNHNSGGNFRYLSPLLTDVQDHLMNVFTEIVETYDIDGLHLDYIRYRGISYGYNPVARIKIKNSLGVDPLHLYSSETTDLIISPDELDKLRWEWSQLRRDAVTDLVRRCNKMILSTRPSCILSAAVKPNLNNAKIQFYQEWDRWLAEGLIDYVVPMNYDQSLSKFAENIDIIYENIPTKYHSGIVMGVAVYNQDALDTQDKVKYTKITGFSGISVFSYDAYKHNLDYFAPIVNEIIKK